MSCEIVDRKYTKLSIYANIYLSIFNIGSVLCWWHYSKLIKVSVERWPYDIRRYCFINSFSIGPKWFSSNIFIQCFNVFIFLSKTRSKGVLFLWWTLITSMVVMYVRLTRCVGRRRQNRTRRMFTQYVYTMCTLAKWHAILWFFCARCVRKTNSYVIAMMFVLLSICPSVCLPGTGVHCDHTVHFSADFTLRLDGPMFRALWHRACPPYS